MTESTLRDAVRYLLVAEGDFKTLQIYRSLLDVQYLLSVMYHNLGATTERDQAAERHLKTEADLRKLETITMDEEVEQILDVVAAVGASLAGR